MAAVQFRHDTTRIVSSLIMGTDPEVRLVVLKFLLGTGKTETIHFQRETALWFFEQLGIAAASGRFVDRRVRRDEARDEEPEVRTFLDTQPDLVAEDWENRGGKRTTRGMEFHEFADGLGLVLETGESRASYTLPDQACLYLREYLAEIEPLLKDGEQVGIALRDIDEGTDAFRAHMAGIDERLRRQGVPIPNRPILALRELARAGIQIWSPTPSSKRIFDWFDQRYGKKLAVDFTIGRSIVLVRGDPYVVKFPLILGYFDGIISLTDLFEHFTVEMLAALSKDETAVLINSFASQYEDFRHIELLPRDLRSSLDAAVSRVVEINQHMGESKWASLQFVEKVLKAFIKKGGTRPPNIHDLRKLALLAEQLGAPAIPDVLVRNTECPAGVRYNEPRVTLTQAVGALHASIKIGALLSGPVTGQEPRTTALR